MSGYALLSEVYQDMDLKPKKRKKKKRVTFQEGPNGPIVPMAPQDMETELLDEEPPLVRDMKASPYRPDGPEYQGLSQASYQMLNEHSVPYPSQTSYPAPRGPTMDRMTIHRDDPDYQEFMEFKRAKQAPAPGRRMTSEPDKRSRSPSILRNPLTGQGEQFNELLLYMFTGFFLLMLYDNIYKLGRDSY
jgi:hypothetical protein